MGKLLYIGSCSGSFYALDRNTGHEVWSYDASMDTGSPNFHGNALFSGDVVVVGTDGVDEGSLYAFDTATGELRWHRTVPGGFPSDLVGRGTRAWAVTMSGEVRCFDLPTGEPVWVFQADTGDRLLRSGLVMIGDRVVASLPSGSVISLDAASGELIWHRRLPSRINTPPTVKGDGIYVGGLDGRIHRLSVEDGDLTTAFELKGPIYGSLLVAGECLLALSAETTLTCLKLEEATSRWSRVSPSTWSSFQPLLMGDLVVVGAESGEVEAFRLSDGATAWTRKLEGEIKGLGMAEGILYVGTSQGRVYAIPLPGPGEEE